ncbi:hypothetical protein EV382_3680 [Micromonospora violae]|uniref:Uncharacterized protein n=1 Tax=Micromonospora violae TaxID=1278207 RepID=A0A4Q7UJA5_9ACTN|nr:hypothetical protein [Micromonospora violae]RZT80431.1 hypothetical protein EV382_3680 [Micromonospora violae]
METTLLLGPVEADGLPPLEQVALTVAGIIGVELVERAGDQRHFFGADDNFAVWLDTDPDTDEPFRSHPFCLDVSNPSATAELGTRLFHQLADSGRFRVLLILNHDCVRSTHFPCEDW